MVVRSRIALLAAAMAVFAAPRPCSAQGILEQMQDEVAGIVGRARPAIVSIEDERAFGGHGRPGDAGGVRPDAGKGDHGHPSGDTGFPRRPMGEPPKVGSGFSIGDGFIVTTADVLSGMKNPIVRTQDGRRLHAAISGIDAEMNIGVLKLDGIVTLPGLKLGYSRAVYPGHFAISIGNQYGHLNSVALTLVAGLRDDGIPAGEHFYPGLIQIAGTVGLGTSGAPILNARGEVIGMIAGIPFGDWTSSPFLNMPPGVRPGGSTGGPRAGGVVDIAVSPTQSGTNGSASPGAVGQSATPGPQIVYMRPPVTSAGFALPIDDMKPVLAGLRAGKLQHCWLGVDMVEERVQQQVDGIPAMKRYVKVSTVYPNSPASSAGLQTGDLLISINERSVSRLANIRAALLRSQPGDTMEVHIERKGARQTVNAHLVARPEPPATGSGSSKH